MSFVQLEVGDTGSFTFKLKLATPALMLKTVAKNMEFYFKDNSIFTHHTPVLNNQTFTLVVHILKERMLESLYYFHSD